MNDPQQKAYVEGFEAARIETADADVQCPYARETQEADQWQRGFDAAARAQDASS